jgi:hypothetical protein
MEASPGNIGANSACTVFEHVIFPGEARTATLNTLKVGESISDSRGVRDLRQLFDALFLRARHVSCGFELTGTAVEACS